MIPLLVSLYVAVPIPAPPKVKVEFRRAENEPAKGLTEAIVPETKLKIYLHRMADLTTEHIAKAQIVERDGFLRIEIGFTKEGTRRMARLSKEHLGKYMAIMVDGKVISAPILQAEITDRAEIAGASREEAERIVKAINGQGQEAADKQLMQGNWKTVSAQGNGKTAPFSVELGVSGDIMTMTYVAEQGEKKVEKYRFTLAPDKSPKHFDQRQVDGKIVYKGIYKLEKDTLTICINLREGIERPAAFETKKRDGRGLLVLKRVKDGKK